MWPGEFFRWRLLGDHENQPDEERQKCYNRFRQQFVSNDELPPPLAGLWKTWGRGFPGAGKKRQPQATCRCPFGT